MESATVTPGPGSDRAPAAGERDQQAGTITPELVDEVAAKVYALILLELKLEHQRQRLPLKGPFSK